MLLLPTIFFYRRLIFITSIIFLGKNIFALLVIQFCMIQFTLATLHSLRIFESKATLWKQTQDECTYLLLFYVLMCFTDFVPDPELRSELGKAYISIMFTNIGLHLISLIRSTITSILLGFKRCFVRRHLCRCLRSFFFCCKQKARLVPSSKKSKQS